MQQDPSRKSLEQVIAEYVQADERGAAPDPQCLLQDYPEYGHDLEEFFDFHRQFVSASELSHSHSDTSPAVEGASPSSLANHPPRHLGGYEILEEIDRGGMGVVYKARDQKLGRTVALKLIRSGELASDEEVERFLSEAEAAAALTHPGIVPIYEVGTWNGLVFYTMAYIEGRSLADAVTAGALEPMEATRIVHKLCAAVGYAHRAGVYHRDLKPANVLLNEAGQPIIIDFGLAKIANRDQSLTRTGQILGTPAYMPPEHACGRSTDIGPAADVYSLGAILYFLCAGQPAFTGSSPFDVLLQVLDRRPPAPSKLNKRVSRHVDHVCLKALEKEPSHRYQNADQLAVDLQRILTDEPIDYPQETLWQQFYRWWQREPILVAHVVGIGATTAIVAFTHLWRGEESAPFPYRMALLTTWLIASFVLQFWVYRARWRDVAIVTWLTVDVTIYTTLITFADPPRSMLLIGYPMMVVASCLFYRSRFVVTTTGLCVTGFGLLAWLFPMDDFVKPDFSAIFICGLAVISLCMLAIIRRVRGLSQFYGEGSA